MIRYLLLLPCFAWCFSVHAQTSPQIDAKTSAGMRQAAPANTTSSQSPSATPATTSQVGVPSGGQFEQAATVVTPEAPVLSGAGIEEARFRQRFSKYFPANRVPENFPHWDSATTTKADYKREVIVWCSANRTALKPEFREDERLNSNHTQR